MWFSSCGSGSPRRSTGRSEDAVGGREGGRPEPWVRGKHGEGSAQRVRIWRQQPGSLFTRDFARSRFAKTAEPALLCVLSDVNSLFPALTIEMPVCSLPGTSPPRGPAVIARIWGLLCAVHTFSSKGGSVPCPYCKNTSWFAERWRGGVPAALLPGSLLFHHHRPAPWCSSRAVPRPLWS